MADLSIDNVFDRTALLLTEEFSGYQLRDAELEVVAHYFEYNADLYAQAYLGD